VKLIEGALFTILFQAAYLPERAHIHFRAEGKERNYEKKSTQFVADLNLTL
jgi:hypothetical protein